IAEACFQNRAYAYLPEPFEREQLLDVVYCALEDRRLNLTAARGEFVQPSLQLDPHSRAWTNKGIHFAAEGQHSKALACYQKALIFDALNAAAWANKGMSLHGEGTYAEVMTCFERAIEIDPRCLRAWERKANILWQTGDLAAALECYVK